MSLTITRNPDGSFNVSCQGISTTLTPGGVENSGSNPLSAGPVSVFSDPFSDGGLTQIGLIAGQAGIDWQAFLSKYHGGDLLLRAVVGHDRSFNLDPLVWALSNVKDPCRIVIEVDSGTPKINPGWDNS